MRRALTLRAVGWGGRRGPSQGLCASLSVCVRVLKGGAEEGEWAWRFHPQHLPSNPQDPRPPQTKPATTPRWLVCSLRPCVWCVRACKWTDTKDRESESGREGMQTEDACQRRIRRWRRRFCRIRVTESRRRRLVPVENDSKSRDEEQEERGVERLGEVRSEMRAAIWRFPPLSLPLMTQRTSGLMGSVWRIMFRRPDTKSGKAAVDVVRSIPPKTKTIIECGRSR